MTPWSDQVEAARQLAIQSFKEFRDHMGGSLDAVQGSFEAIADRGEALVEAFRAAPPAIRAILHYQYGFNDLGAFLEGLRLVVTASRRAATREDRKRGRPRRDPLLEYLVTLLYVTYEDATGGAPTISKSAYSGADSEFVEYVNTTLGELGYSTMTAKTLSTYRKNILRRPVF